MLTIICFKFVSFSASLGLTDDQREFQRVALEFAKNELAPEMQKWDQEVCEKKDSNFFFRKIVQFYDHYGRLSDLFSVFNLTVTICL